MKSLHIKQPGTVQLLGALPGLVIYIFLSFLIDCNPEDKGFYTSLGIGALIINLWIAEPIPIWMSSLLPLVLVPGHGIVDFHNALKSYYSTTILLFLGGFLLAYCVEKWQLHKRIAFKLLSYTGDSPSGIVWGIMLTTCLISMWISNTATAIMMLPVAMSIAAMVSDHEHRNNKAFLKVMMLGIAYSANIGGIATIIGTPPNIVYKGYINDLLHSNISFLKWMALGVPLSLAMLWLSYLILVKLIFRFKHKNLPEVARMLDAQSEKLGAIKGPELRTLIVFSIAAGLWILGQPINALMETLELPFKVEEYGVALVFGLVLFAVPSGQKDSKDKTLLVVSDLKKISWSILLLFGGGMCMAKGLEASGVIKGFGAMVSGLGDIDYKLLLLIIIVSSVVLTALMSNVAMAQIYLPVVFGISASIGIENPHIFGLLVTFGCSFDFMFPFSTPPNAVVFGSGKLKVRDMAIAGFSLNIAGIILLWLCGMFIIPYLF